MDLLLNPKVSFPWSRKSTPNRRLSEDTYNLGDVVGFTRDMRSLILARFCVSSSRSVIPRKNRVK